MPLPTTANDVWPTIEKWPFAVLGFVNPRGESRAAGVMYKVRDRVLHVITGPDTWKARHIRNNPHVSVTVPVQRFPIRSTKIPPAVITFSGHATVVAIDDVASDLRDELTHGIEDAGDMCVIRIKPAGRFVTYGIGVPPMTMRHPERAIARVPIA
ncbi:MAG: pyridoxamine 5'-phosphate oxidase family protein [Actinomycetota bacterium]|nr:pyridoxamine 5'-phosphate oxidase family protein [Actinomycetota bacterium]